MCRRKRRLGFLELVDGKGVPRSLKPNERSHSRFRQAAADRGGGVVDGAEDFELPSVIDLACGCEAHVFAVVTVARDRRMGNEAGRPLCQELDRQLPVAVEKTVVETASTLECLPADEHGVSRNVVVEQ